MPGKRLYRSPTEKKIAGVCGGIAEYFDIDPVFVRIAAFLITIPHGFGVVVYLICWAAIPVRPLSEGETQTGPDGQAPVQTAPANEPPPQPPRISGELIMGGLLIFIGFCFLMFNVGFFDMEFFRFWRWRYIWPVILIVLGLYVVGTSLRSARRNAGKGAL